MARYTAEQLGRMPNEKLDRIILSKLFTAKERHELRRWERFSRRGWALRLQEVLQFSSTDKGAIRVIERMKARGFTMYRSASGRIGFMIGANIAYAGPVSECFYVRRVVVIAAILAFQRDAESGRCGDG